MSSHRGACRWNDFCWVMYISLAISSGLVMICPIGFCRQSSVLVVVGLNIFLWIILGLILSNVLYLVMVFLQLRPVCLVMILWASFFAFLAMLASCSIHVWMSIGLSGNGGILGVCMSCRLFIFGLLCRRLCGLWHAALIAFRVLW